MAEIFFKWASCNELLILEELYELRQVCKEWKTIIETSCPEVAQWRCVQEGIQSVLSYDTKTYDQYSYKRRQIEAELQERVTKYESLMIPYLVEYENDFDNNGSTQEILYGVETDIFLTEFYIFLNCYLNSPSPFIKIYKSQYIEEIIRLQQSHLCDILLNNSTLDQLLYFIPLCYSKHYKTQWDNAQYINAMFYVNCIDKKINSQLPADGERFIVVKLNITDLTDKELHSSELTKLIFTMTDDINCNDFSKVRPLVMQSFSNSLQILIDKQVYNLV